jgi:3-polyprenyl-4-hydroxybenzoate decarboxylase
MHGAHNLSPLFYTRRDTIGEPMAATAAKFDRQSLRGFIAMVEADHPDELLRIRQTVDTRFEMTAIAYELERAGRSPVIVFENPARNAMPVVTNVAANRKLLAACFGVAPKELPDAFRERCQRAIPCEVVDDAAWNEVVIDGEDLDLASLPIPLQFAVDGGPYSYAAAQRLRRLHGVHRHEKDRRRRTQTAIMATFATEFYVKQVIVVDDDVDIFNTDDVMWALATRVRPDRDIFFIPGAKGAMLDPTSDPQNFTVTKMGIDATRPAGRDFAERLAISDEQRAKARALLAAAAAAAGVKE